MLTLSSNQKENEQLARRINREAQTAAGSPYAGKWVALLGGRIVATDDTLEGALSSLRRVEPDRGRGVVFEASRNYDLVDHIWSA